MPDVGTVRIKPSSPVRNLQREQDSRIGDLELDARTLRMMESVGECLGGDPQDVLPEVGREIARLTFFDERELNVAVFRQDFRRRTQLVRKINGSPRCRA